MKITQTDSRVTESEVMISKEDLESILIQHFKTLFDAKRSELSVTFEDEDQMDIQVSFRRVEIIK